MGKGKLGNRIRNLLFLILTAAVAGAMSAAAAGNDYKIEQVYVNMPEITAYYRCPKPEESMEGYLDGEKLTLEENVSFARTGEAVEYYILLDISASLTGERFTDIRTSLKQFIENLRSGDRVILLTFGDEVQVVLDGSDQKKDAVQKIDSLKNDNQNTVLFEAIDEAAAMIWEAGDVSEKRRVVMVISDGKDCADQTRSTESVQNTLISRGIAIYTLAVENNEGDSETEIADYRGKFSALSRNTGGIPWTISNGNSVMDGLSMVQDTVMNSYRAKFLSSTNKISNRKEDFVIRFREGSNLTDTCSVLVGRGKSDNESPEILSIESKDTNSITIVFSEAVLNAEDISNYSVKKDGRAIPVQQVVRLEEENGVTLIFDQELYEGDYEIRVNGVTDNSNESNPLKNSVQVLHSDLPEPTTTEATTTTTTEATTTTTTEATTTTTTEATTVTTTERTTVTTTQEARGILVTVLKWWPVVLTGIVFALFAVVLIVVRKTKEKKKVLIIDEKVVHVDQIEEKKRVHVEQQKGPEKPIVLWISNGKDEPRRMEYTIRGSAIVGRSLQCDISCDDPMMSKQHFVLELNNGNIFITDLQSCNGTSVNGILIREQYLLSPYDEIAAGNLRFRIEW